ncbi:MAG: hypothetical protein Ct9H300mP4_02110 [Gammaproteobacteria bacterium]|nr:MAG: hypothetical protein Ct9H300mP4_02110 [Gammaproteobacteria bacterium]
MKFGCIDSLRSAITENTAAVLVEPIQGEAGIVNFPIHLGYQKFVSSVRKTTCFLNLDEVQSGLGRTEKCLPLNILLYDLMA